MKIVKWVGVLGTLAMSIVLLNGFINGSFFDDGSALMENPWGIVSLVDLYVGFVIFSLWIIYRESSLFVQIVLVGLMMIFGFLTASVYLFYVFHQSNGDLLTAMHGKHAIKYRKRDDVDETN